MNPKFRDLQIQAFDECKTFEDGQFRTDEVFERFAQLIVEECLEQIYSVTIDNPTDDWDQGYDSGIHQAAATIKEHFGIDSGEDIDETCPRCGDNWSGTSCGIPACGWVTGVEE